MFMGGVIVEDGDLARDVVSLNPDVIFLTGNFLARRFRTLTVTTPIVATMSDPLETGMVQSLARPGGDLTGVSEDAGIEIWGKRLELLKEAVPSMAKLAYVGVQLAQMGATQTTVESAAQRFGVSAIGVSVEPNPAEYGEDHNRPKLQRIAKKRLFSYFRQYAAADVLGVAQKARVRNRCFESSFLQRGVSCEPEFRPASAIDGSRRLCWRAPAGDLFIVALTGKKISVGLRTN
jgi:putative tryptophan/tyrosine transport system substrate-binding protein